MTDASVDGTIDRPSLWSVTIGKIGAAIVDEIGRGEGMPDIVPYLAFVWMTVLLAASVAAVIRLPTAAGSILGWTRSP